MNRKAIIGIIAVLVIVVVLTCVFGGQALQKAAQEAALKLTPTASSAESETLQPITAKGVVVPARWASLAFQSNGVVKDMPVKESDAVKSGDVLATLDTTGLELAVDQAKANLESAQAQLALEQVTPAPAKVEAARAVVSSTQVAYWDALARYGNRDAQKVIDNAEVENARKALESAQWQYDAMWADPLTRGLVEHSPVADQLKAAQTSYDVAVARSRLNSSGTGATALQQTAAELARAKAELYALQHPTTAEGLAIRQAEVRRAELALEQAQLDLARARLTAPFDGTVAQVNLRTGEPASPGATAMVLADLAQLTVETTDLDEWGAAHIKIGQDVMVAVNALDDAEFSGTVTALAPKSNVLPTGDTAYTATVALKTNDPRLRWGMTVKVIFPR